MSRVRDGVVRAIESATLCLVLATSSISMSRAENVDFRPYAAAADFCRGDVSRPWELSSDKRVLCFDGELSPPLDISLADRLEDGGFFVLRSPGGSPRDAAELAERLRQRHAVVVAYDYCFAACASYLIVASAMSIVLKDTLVAWHHIAWEPGCISWQDAADHGPKRLEKIACPDAPEEHRDLFRRLKEFDEAFYYDRATAPFESPPESNMVRRILSSKIGGTGVYPHDLLWTWNPRHSASTLRTKIIYEAYPRSQEEVDEIAARFWVRVIYDP